MKAQQLILVDLLVQNRRCLKVRKYILAALVLPFYLLTIPANASCYTQDGSTRLGNYCALAKIQGARIDVPTAQIIDYKLKIEGSINGLGLPTRLATNTTSKSIYPILSYSDNINGGNSPEPLVLGNLTFEGDEELVLKEGVLTGFGAGVSGRYIHAEGKYFTYGVNASYAHSPKYGLGIATTSANLSSINHIKNWWYLDIHANTSRVRKDITDETNSNLSIVTSKVFEPVDSVYSEASFGINRYFAESYNQNQLQLGYKTIHANGVYSALSLTFGDAVENQLATKYALSAQIVTQAANKPLKLSASYSQADGGMLLGVKRDETTMSVSASYPIWKNLTANVGYRKTDSTIDYFDVSTPIFGIQFAAVQF
jgi:hypothetical protein